MIQMQGLASKPVLHTLDTGHATKEITLFVAITTLLQILFELLQDSS